MKKIGNPLVQYVLDEIYKQLLVDEASDNSAFLAPIFPDAKFWKYNCIDEKKYDKEFVRFFDELSDKKLVKYLLQCIFRVHTNADKLQTLLEAVGNFDIFE